MFSCFWDGPCSSIPFLSDRLKTGYLSLFHTSFRHPRAKQLSFMAGSPKLCMIYPRLPRNRRIAIPKAARSLNLSRSQLTSDNSANTRIPPDAFTESRRAQPWRTGINFPLLLLERRCIDRHEHVHGRFAGFVRRRIDAMVRA